MSLIVKPHGDFVALTTAESAKVNDQLNQLYIDYNGGIVDANIHALANITQSKIAGLVQDLNVIRAQRVNEVSVQTFITPGGTYTKPTDLLFALVICVGGGAGGGGPALATAGRRSGGGGGGSSTAEIFLMASLIAFTEIVTVGGGGGGGSSSTGNAGGNTSFGALAVAAGGNPGAASVVDDAEARGGLGGAAVTGMILSGGQDAGMGLSAPGAHCGGNGGSSKYGGGGAGATPGVVAQVGRDFGGGGGGGLSDNLTASPGAVGGNGICWVVEFKA